MLKITKTLLVAILLLFSMPMVAFAEKMKLKNC